MSRMREEELLHGGEWLIELFINLVKWIINVEKMLEQLYSSNFTQNIRSISYKIVKHLPAVDLKFQVQYRT